MKRLTIIGLWPDDVVKYCTEKCDCRRYAFDRILYHRGGRDARERICIPVVDRSGAVTTYLDLPVLFLEANAVYLHLDDGSDIFLSNTQMLLIANEVERLRAEAAGTGLKTLEKWFESGLPTARSAWTSGPTTIWASRSSRRNSCCASRPSCAEWLWTGAHCPAWHPCATTCIPCASTMNCAMSSTRNTGPA